MAGYFIDFAIASALIVVLTALMGNISNTIGERMFGRNKSGKHVEASRRIQQGWKVVGGKNNAPKQAHRWVPPLSPFAPCGGERAALFSIRLGIHRPIPLIFFL